MKFLCCLHLTQLSELHESTFSSMLYKDLDTSKACLSHTHFELVVDVGKVVTDKVGVGCINWF